MFHGENKEKSGEVRGWDGGDPAHPESGSPADSPGPPHHPSGWFRNGVFQTSGLPDHRSQDRGSEWSVP